MSLKRLNKIEALIYDGKKKGSQIIYEHDIIYKILDLLDEEKARQDRKMYMAAYYVKNKELMDSRAKQYYENNKEQISEKRKQAYAQNSKV